MHNLFSSRPRGLAHGRFAQWDKHVTSKLSEHTDRAARHAARLSSHGGYLVIGSRVPYVTTDFS